MATVSAVEALESVVSAIVSDVFLVVRLRVDFLGIGVSAASVETTGCSVTVAADISGTAAAFVSVTSACSKVPVFSSCTFISGDISLSLSEAHLCIILLTEDSKLAESSDSAGTSVAFTSGTAAEAVS